MTNDQRLLDWAIEMDRHISEMRDRTDELVRDGLLTFDESGGAFFASLPSFTEAVMRTIGPSASANAESQYH